MPHEDKKPDQDSITRLASHLESVWSKAHSQWKVYDEYYHRTYKVWPEGSKRPEYRPSTATNIVDHAADTQLAYEPIIERFPVGEGEQHEVNADIVERWLKAIMDDSALYEPVLTWKQAGKFLIHYGYSVVEGPVLDFSERPENQKLEWNPFRNRAPHPSNILLPPFEKKPRVAIKKRRFYNVELEALTDRKERQGREGVKQWKYTGEDYDTIEATEYWSMSWHALIAGEELLYVEPNTWGFVPFKQAYAGFGQELTQQYDPDPMYLAQGVLHPVMDSILREAQAMSGRHNALMMATFALLGTRRDPAEVAQALKGEGVMQGEQGDLWWLQFPDLPNWLMQATTQVQQDIERGTFSQLLAGLREEGVSTVGQHAMLRTDASRKFAPVSRQLDHLATLVGSDVLRLADVLNETIMVRGVSLKPEQIEHNYAVKVTFELVDPVLNLQQRELGLREVQLGGLSWETYWSSIARLQDATGERKRLIKDQVYKDPRVVQMMVNLMAQGMGLFEIFDRLEREAKERITASQTARATSGNGQAAESVVPAGSPQEPEATAALREMRQPIAPDVAKPPLLNLGG